MCAPCKVVINGENDNAAETADTLASLIQGTLRPSADDTAADDALYELACVEVEHILGVRQQALEMAKRIDAPDRWQKLMERLYG